MRVSRLRNGRSVDFNVQKNRVILSVGDDDRVEYDFDTETQAYDAAEEYCSVLQDFLALLKSYRLKCANEWFPTDVEEENCDE